jgi:hypothetical protein
LTTWAFHAFDTCKAETGSTRAYNEVLDAPTETAVAVQAFDAETREAEAATATGAAIREVADAPTVGVNSTLTGTIRRPE